MAEADHPILEDSMEKSWHLEVEAAGEEAGRSFYLIQNITRGESFPAIDGRNRLLCEWATLDSRMSAP